MLKRSNFFYFIKNFIIISSLVIPAFIVWAWNMPSSNPPSGNVPSPIDTSSTAQTKTGNLTIDGVFRVGRFSSAPTGATGSLYFDTSANKLKVYDNASWTDISGGGSGLSGSGAVGQVSFWTATSTLSGDNALFWDNTNKRLGIGTTAPGAPLHINNTAAYHAITQGAASMNYYDTAKYWEFLNPGGQLRLSQTWDSNKELVFTADSTSSTYASISAGPIFTSGLRLIANSATLTIGGTSGNVGIGTTGPKGRLDVAGGISVGSYAGVNVPPSNGMIVSGNVGIGTTNPSYKLDVQGGQINASGGLCIAGDCKTGWSQIGLPSGTSGQTLRHDGTNWVANSVIYNNGTNVGIGTTSPGADLHIGSGNLGYITRDRMIIQPPQHTGGPWKFKARDDASNAWLDITYGTNNLVTVKHTGDIGIGTVSPAQKLDVNGNIKGTNLISSSLTSGRVPYVTTGGQLTDSSTLTFSNNLLTAVSAGGAAGSDGNYPYITNQYILSRGMNLVVNGSGMLGNNYNFTGFSGGLDQTELYAGAGSFKETAHQRMRTTDEYIAVDTSKSYRGTAYFKSTTLASDNRAYFGIVSYDIDKNEIQSQHHMKYAGATDTALASDLNPDDTTITLVDATGWNNGAPDYARYFGWYPYTNSKGYSYPDYTYTRNGSWNYSVYNQPAPNRGTWAEGGISGNVITLRAPWPGPALSAGTKVRNASYGATYKYSFGSQNIPNSWTKMTGIIEGVDLSGTNNNQMFAPGTAFVKLLFLLNYSGSSPYGNVMNVSSISLTEVAEGNVLHFQPMQSTLDATNYFDIKSSGNNVIFNVDTINKRVGIGTASPGQTLDVSGGNIRTSGQLISTVGAGTAPLTVSSNTKVTNLNADLLDNQEGDYYNQRAYTVANNYLGGYYVSGGTEKPNDAIFGGGKLKLAMLSGSNLGFGGGWNDVLWLSAYSGGDVKGSYAIVGDKYSDDLYFSRQNFDSASWGVGHKLWHTGNDGSGSGLDADLLDGHDTSYFQTALTNPITGTGASGYISKWTGTTTQGNSNIYDNGTNVGIGTTTPASLLTLGSGGQFQVNSSGDIVKLKNLTYSWPSSHTANGYLRNDGSGNLTWETVSSGGTEHNLLSATHLDTLTASPAFGDLIYANNTPKWTKLTGNITTTKKFLTQTGNGTISAAPIWDTLLAADLPSHSHSAADITAGTLGVARGGTGAATFTANGVLYGNGTSALQATAAGTNNYLLYSNNGTPAWTNSPTISGANITSLSASNISAGTLAIARGGTNATTFTASQLIRMNSGGTALESSGKTVPTGDLVGTSDTQTLTNKTLSTGSLWNGAAIGVGYGGTGATTLTANGVLLGNGTSAISATAAPTGTYKVLSTLNGTTIGWNALEVSHIPNLDASKIASGNLGIARMPTGGNWDITSDLTIESPTLFVGQASGSYAGNVGIGTTTPAVSLVVNKSGATSRIRINADSGRSAMLELASNGTTVWHLEKYTDNTFRIVESGANARLTIAQGGNVGIGGPTNPSYALQVTGSINATSSLCINGDCKTSWPTGGGGGLPTGAIILGSSPDDQNLINAGCFPTGQTITTDQMMILYLYQC